MALFSEELVQLWQLDPRGFSSSDWLVEKPKVCKCVVILQREEVCSPIIPSQNPSQQHYVTKFDKIHSQNARMCVRVCACNLTL